MNIHVIVNISESFRITINLTSVPYHKELADRSSLDFRELSTAVSVDVEHIYSDIAGQQSISVLQFRSVIFIAVSEHKGANARKSMARNYG